MGFQKLKGQVFITFLFAFLTVVENRICYAMTLISNTCNSPEVERCDEQVTHQSSSLMKKAKQNRVLGLVNSSFCKR